MDLAGADGQNVGCRNLWGCKEPRRGWLCFRYRVRRIVYVTSDFAGILASWRTPNPSRVWSQSCSRAHVYWTLLSLFRKLPWNEKSLSYIWAASSRCVGQSQYLLAFSCGNWRPMFIFKNSVKFVGLKTRTANLRKLSGNRLLCLSVYGSNLLKEMSPPTWITCRHHQDCHFSGSGRFVSPFPPSFRWTDTTCLALSSCLSWSFLDSL
jgi:hypothetical protein